MRHVPRPSTMMHPPELLAISTAMRSRHQKQGWPQGCARAFHKWLRFRSGIIDRGLFIIKLQHVCLHQLPPRALLLLCMITFHTF